MDDVKAMYSVDKGQELCELCFFFLFRFHVFSRFISLKGQQSGVLASHYTQMSSSPNNLAVSERDNGDREYCQQLIFLSEEMENNGP